MEKQAAIKRNRMISVGFARVSKKRPCRICGKPTYCGFSRDEGTSICMRISAGSRGLSRNGGNIHVHPEIPFVTIQPRIMRPISQSIPLASPEIRDAVFRELIKISPASNYREEVVTGPGGLLSRGVLGRPIFVSSLMDSEMDPFREVCAHIYMPWAPRR